MNGIGLLEGERGSIEKDVSSLFIAILFRLSSVFLCTAILLARCCQQNGKVLPMGWQSIANRVAKQTVLPSLFFFI